MPTCSWCQSQIKSYEEHMNIFSAYTCQKRTFPLLPNSQTVSAVTPKCKPISAMSVYSYNVPPYMNPSTFKLSSCHATVKFTNTTQPMDIDEEDANIFESSYKRKGITLTKLYHQTSPDRADKIMEEGMLKPGFFGMAGPAIYFATKPEDTYHKAMRIGVILECWVDLGLILTLAEFGNGNLNKEKVKEQGYDTVLIPRYRGNEYAVYDSDRIKKIRIFNPKVNVS